ncbi:hypothetical protein B0H13DRAFT_2360580 [Mycena leptocephala]|nr:hypothetical protein B0H13DRAFT_2360580 [Mycena leptocephala]
MTSLRSAPAPQSAQKRKHNRVESDSEDENSVQGSDSPPPSRSPSPELREILPAAELYKEQQKKANDAKKELWVPVAQRKLADITNQNDTPPKRGRKKLKTVVGPEDETKEVKHLAHKFTMTKQMWIQSLERFENDKSKVQGVLADLLDIFPSKFHGKTMRSDWLVKLFHTEMGTQRSNAAGRVRRDCGAELFDCTAADLSTSESRRDKFRKLIGYVETETDPQYEIFNVDILHKNYTGLFNRDTVFRGPKLHLVVFAGLTRGQTACTAMKMTGVPTPATGKCVSQLWGLRNSTPGSIGASAISARWAASADIELTPRGICLEIFREWDAIFFPETNSSLAGNATGDNTQKQIDDVMAQLDADEEELPEAAD